MGVVFLIFLSRTGCDKNKFLLVEDKQGTRA
jgi:hypothetical protein